MPSTERILASRMQEICESGLKRAEAAALLPLRYSSVHLERQVNLVNLVS